MPTIQELAATIEVLAPLAYQENYDNAGLIVGDMATEITGVLVSLDVTEAVIAEAKQRGCNVVVAHHPIIFKGLKKLNGKNYVERTVISAIKNDVAIYASHTNLDNVSNGVNATIAQKLGLQNAQILRPKPQQTLTKITTFVPTKHTQKVLNALYQAGAGKIANYDRCSFSATGIGTFRANENAKPFLGKAHLEEQVTENRIELVFSSHLKHSLVAALKQAHPYETPAFYLQNLDNENPDIGSGMIGDLPIYFSEIDFLSYLKTQMDLQVLRHTPLLGKRVRKVAVCGGSGGFLLPDAQGQRADVFITGDYKYHEFFDAEDKLIIIDIGHYESEVFTKDLIHKYLSEKFTTFAVLLARTNTNPVQYYF